MIPCSKHVYQGRYPRLALLTFVFGAVVLSIKRSVQLTRNQSFVLKAEEFNVIPTSQSASGELTSDFTDDKASNSSMGRETSNSPNRPFVGPKFLIGILCVQEDVERRQFIRDSFVSFYKDTEDSNSDRICSLSDVLDGKIDENSCQIAYTFVVGGLVSGPTQLLTPNVTHPIMIDTPDEYSEESDVAFLNIRENMNDGKTPTFYRYASLSLDKLKERQVSFDYVMKIDLDTMLFPPNLIEYALEHFPTNLKQVYMGRKVIGGKSHYRWAAGPFQILSSELAAIISGPESIGRQNGTEFEDKEISKRVEYLGNNASKIWLPPSALLIQPSKTAHGVPRPKYSSYNFTGVLYGHTEWGKKGRWSRFSPGPYFKYLPTTRKIWRHYLYWYTHNMTSVDNTYHLFDMPPRGDIHTVVRRNDYVFSNQDFDSSPIVLEAYKLVFFPIEGNGAETWRRLFRRMHGYVDWRNETLQFDGLKYLSDFSLEEADEIMTSEAYTRAIILQNPKTRLLSAYVDKVLQDGRSQFMRTHCCGTMQQLILPGSEFYVGKCAKTEEPISFEMFVNITQDCDHPYWRPQSRKMEPKYFSFLNYVGHYETIEKDAKALLQKIGAWEKYGQDGWGSDGAESIFTSHTSWNVAGASKLLPQDYDTVLAKIDQKGSVFESDYKWNLMDYR